jgi:hypothetical protein
VQGAFREVADALSNRRWLALQVDIGRPTLAAQSERARLAKLRYDNGAAPYLEVLDAQRDLLTVEQQLVQTRRALLSSQVACVPPWAAAPCSRHLHQLIAIADMTPQLKKKLIPAALVVAVLVLGYVAWQKMRPAGPVKVSSAAMAASKRPRSTSPPSWRAGSRNPRARGRLRQGRPAAGHHAGGLADGPARRSARRQQQALDTVVGAQAQVAMRESDKAAALAMVAQREANSMRPSAAWPVPNAVAEGARRCRNWTTTAPACAARPP